MQQHKHQTSANDVNQNVNFSVRQLKRTTGHLCPSSPLWSPASIRTLRRKSLRSIAGSARECTTSGCVCTPAWSVCSILSRNILGEFLIWFSHWSEYTQVPPLVLYRWGAAGKHQHAVGNYCWVTSTTHVKTFSHNVCMINIRHSLCIHNLKHHSRAHKLIHSNNANS